MSVQSVLARGRAAQLRLMRDKCRIERKTGEQVFDPVTGTYTQAWEILYEGRCEVKRADSGSDSDLAGGAQNITLHRYPVKLPWDAEPEVRREDRFTLTASDDAWGVGRPMEVVDVASAGVMTARRITVEDRS